MGPQLADGFWWTTKSFLCQGWSYNSLDEPYTRVNTVGLHVLQGGYLIWNIVYLTDLGGSLSETRNLHTFSLMPKLKILKPMREKKLV